MLDGLPTVFQATEDGSRSCWTGPAECGVNSGDGGIEFISDSARGPCSCLYLGFGLVGGNWGKKSAAGSGVAVVLGRTGLGGCLSLWLRGPVSSLVEGWIAG